MKDKIKEWSKKWWFWVIIGVLVIGIIGNFGNEENNDTPEQETMPITYIITGETLGELGKKVVLNANTDSPVTKYLYKLPEGTYIVTTTGKKSETFFIVKDEVAKTGTEDYPEELQYVGEQYSLTNGEDDLNGRAKKSDEITIAKDESILIVGTSTFKFEKK